MRPTLERLHTVREIAEMAKVPKRTMLRRLLRLHRSEGGDWLMWDGNTIKVCLSRLRKAHPTMFAVQYATAEELQDVVERVVQVEESTADIKMRQNALSAALRNLGKLRGQCVGS